MKSNTAKFITPYGVFEIELDIDAAPITAGYFHALIESGAFDGATFFRIVNADNGTLRTDFPIEVVQGGLKSQSTQTLMPINHEPTSETHILHHQWTLSTARDGPGETYGSFFICMRDELELDFGGRRHPDGLGFAAFGRVCSGFDTVKAIFARGEKGEFLTNEVPILKAYLL